MNLQEGSSEIGTFTMLYFSKQHALFTMDPEKKTIKVRFTRLRASKAKMNVTPSDMVVQETKLDIGKLTS